MYEIIKSVINAQQYELSAILHKIDTIWVQGGITDDQRTELIALARDKADPAKSYAPWQEQITAVYAEINALKTEIALLKNNTGESGSEQDPDDEWPEYVQPTGAHDAYNKGAKVTWNGRHKICQMDGCVWDPDTYPAAWKDAEETETAE